MIGAPVGWIDAMIGGEKDGVARAHSLLDAREPAVHLAQCASVTLAVAAMAPEHIEFDQVDKKQAGKIPVQPVQRRLHAFLVSLCVIARGQTPASEEVLNFADANHVLASLL